MTRLNFPKELSEQQRLLTVLDTQVVMEEWHVSTVDRSFLKELVCMSPTVDQFLLTLRKLKM